MRMERFNIFTELSPERPLGKVSGRCGEFMGWMTATKIDEKPAREARWDRHHILDPGEGSQLLAIAKVRCSPSSQLWSDSPARRKLRCVWAKDTTKERRPCWSVDQLPDLSGRVALVSGGSNGLGLHTAIQLRAKGAQVIVISRTWTTSASEAEASPPDEDTAMDRKQGPKIEHIWADFSDLDSVKAAADKFKQRNLPLHILVNNVGCIADFSLAKHGIETQFTVNHFGPVVLTNELLPVIEASQPSRIVNITSMAHMFVFPKIFYENVNNQKVFDPEVRYNETKLANIHFTRELQRRLDAKYANLSRECAIYVNCVHPGAVDTNGPRENPKGHDVKNKLINSIRISVEKGALTQIYVAGARDVEEKGWKGKYFVPYCELADPSAIATNQDQAERTWDWTAYMLREHFDPDFDYCV